MMPRLAASQLDARLPWRPRLVHPSDLPVRCLLGHDIATTLLCPAMSPLEHKLVLLEQRDYTKKMLIWSMHKAQVINLLQHNLTSPASACRLRASHAVLVLQRRKGPAQYGWQHFDIQTLTYPPCMGPGCTRCTRNTCALVSQTACAALQPPAWGNMRWLPAEWTPHWRARLAQFITSGLLQSSAPRSSCMPERASCTI